MVLVENDEPWLREAENFRRRLASKSKDGSINGAASGHRGSKGVVYLRREVLGGSCPRAASPSFSGATSSVRPRKSALVCFKPRCQVPATSLSSPAQLASGPTDLKSSPTPPLSQHRHLSLLCLLLSCERDVATLIPTTCNQRASFKHLCTAQAQQLASCSTPYRPQSRVALDVCSCLGCWATQPPTAGSDTPPAHRIQVGIDRPVREAPRLSASEPYHSEPRLSSAASTSVPERPVCSIRGLSSGFNWTSESLTNPEYMRVAQTVAAEVAAELPSSTGTVNTVTKTALGVSA